jgi:hypothetical protein
LQRCAPRDEIFAPRDEKDGPGDVVIKQIVCDAAGQVRRA